MSNFNPTSAPELIKDLWSKEVLRSKNILCGINDDDCAIIELGDKIIGISTDFLNNRPICLEFEIATFFDLGRLTVASNLSDIIGSGLEPHSFMLGLMVERSFSEGHFLEYVRGVKYELDKIGIPLIGGDTKLGRDNNYLGIAIGTANSTKELIIKNRAKPGDVIFVSGEIGSVAAAISFLNSKFSHDEAFQKLKGWSKDTLINPSLPIELSRLLSRLELSLGGTDLSDGLSSDLYDLCKSSGVGAIINADLLPINNFAKQIANLTETEYWKLPFLTGGDFQFIFTVGKEDVENILRFPCSKIGEITDEKSIRIERNNTVNELKNFGHNDSNNLNFADEVSFHLKML
ncbi:thiamine-phosphate kinase [uncultured Draconibacterium sp.]|uniref:thiamine-phosphate kinase n=1 Tax=uncultured Draconibacterium sp. TaxID=1573823 RepID=UPI0029C790DE|nr:thiamine-phosphate kinase [uncultured Draconibacterium sp.]